MPFGSVFPEDGLSKVQSAPKGPKAPGPGLNHPGGRVRTRSLPRSETVDGGRRPAIARGQDPQGAALRSV